MTPWALLLQSDIGIYTSTGPFFLEGEGWDEGLNALCPVYARRWSWLAAQRVGMKNHHYINPKRSVLAVFANGNTQENAGGIRTKNRGASLRYHSEEKETAGNISGT